MISKPRLGLAGAVASILMLAAPAAIGLELAGAAASLEPFFGTYVGVAEVKDLRAGDAALQRDMDIVIEPYKEGGFRIHWVNVSLVNGKRAMPGVERRVQTVLDQIDRCHQLAEPLQGEKLALNGDDHRPGRRQRIDCQQPE